MQIRRPEPNEWPQVVSILLDSFGAEYQKSFRCKPERLKKFVLRWNIDEDVWVAFDDRVVGVLNLSSRFSKNKSIFEKLRIIFGALPLPNAVFAFRGALKPRLHFKNVLNIEQIAVSTSCQGKGIGFKLLEFAQDRAKELGLEKLALIVYGKNTAVRLYKRFGFNVVKTLRAWIYRSMLGYEEVFFMVKEL